MQPLPQPGDSYLKGSQIVVASYRIDDKRALLLLVKPGGAPHYTVGEAHLGTAVMSASQYPLFLDAAEDYALSLRLRVGA